MLSQIHNCVNAMLQCFYDAIMLIKMFIIATSKNFYYTSKHIKNANNLHKIVMYESNYRVHQFVHVVQQFLSYLYTVRN